MEGRLSANFTSSSQGSTDVISILVGSTLDQVGLLSGEGAEGRVVPLELRPGGYRGLLSSETHFCQTFKDGNYSLSLLSGCYWHPFYRGAAGIQRCGAGKAG